MTKSYKGKEFVALTQRSQSEGVGEWMAKVEIGPTASGKTVQLAKGSEAQLTLPETRTAGYSWKVVSAALSEFSIEDGGFTPASGVGGTGSHRWILKAQTAGTATLEMFYGRSWDEAANAKQRFRVSIEVS